MTSLTAYTSQAKNVRSSLSSQLSSLRSSNGGPSGAIAAKAEALLTSQLTTIAENVAVSATGIAASSVASIAGSMVNTLSSFISSDSSSLTALKPTISDPINSSLGSVGGGTGSKGNAFITSSMVDHITPIDFSNGVQTSATKVSQFDTTALTAVAARQGYSTPTTDAQLASLQNVSFSDASSVVLGSVLATNLVAAATSTSLSTGISSQTNNQLTGFVQQYATKFPGVPGISNTLANNYNTNYATVTDQNGNAINGIPNTTDPSLLSALGSVISGACSEFEIPEFNAYAATQSFLNTLMELLLDNNLLALFNEIILCSSLWNSETKRTAIKRLPSLASSGNTALVAAVVTSVGGSVISGSADLITSMCTARSPDSTAPTDIQSVMTTTNQTPIGLFGAGNVENNYVWNSSALNSCNSTSLSSIVDPTITDMSNVPNSDFIF